jgi:hypothetical protein
MHPTGQQLASTGMADHAAAAPPDDQAGAAAPAPTTSDTALPPGWASLWDPHYSRWYYVHAASGRSQWEAPSDAEAEAAAASASFHYYDPAGRLLGPFSRAQLAAWRGMLPMDLLLLTQDHPAVTAAAAEASGAAAAGGSPAAAQRHAGRSSATLQLAELLGDAALLAHFKQSQAQQQQATSPKAADPQEQPQQQWPPKAVAPPASVWKTWVDRHNSSQLGSDNGGSDGAWPQTAAAAAAAAATGACGPIRPGGGGISRGGTAAPPSSSSGGSGSSSFERYAAAALQGLPPDDEAVQLAQHATAHGYSFSQVLQSYREAGNAAAADAAGVGGIRITQDGVEALMVKDPRSGRLSVAPGSGGGGGGGGASSAVELYGDLSRWIAPEALEEALQKSSAARKRQQQQQQPYGAGIGPQAQRPGPAGGAALLGDGKRARVALG